MKKIIVVLLIISNGLISKSQDKKEISSYKSSIFEVSISQGLQGNFFVDYDREVKTDGRYIVPYLDDFNELTF